jgi:hypothetical protein
MIICYIIAIIRPGNKDGSVSHCEPSDIPLMVSLSNHSELGGVAISPTEQPVVLCSSEIHLYPIPLILFTLSIIEVILSKDF